MPETERDAVLALAENIRAMVRMLSPEHITPLGKRQIERVLNNHTQAPTPEEADR